MLGNNVQVEVRTEIELSVKALTTKSLVGDSRTADGNPGVGQIVCRCLTYEGIDTNPIHPELASIKGLVEGKESAIGVGAGAEVHVAVARTEQSCGDTGPIIGRVPHVLHAEL